ncbi:MAG: COQ9 family protein [Reyranellaceae bacterium]
MTTDLPEIPDLDEADRDRLADAFAGEAAFDGWSRTALASAARQLGLPAGEAERLFPSGPLQVIGYLSERSDRRTIAELENAGVAALKVRDRIKLAVRTRLEVHGGEREAVRRAMGLLALPFNAGLAARLLYRTVDALWYAVGDTSTDFSFYTKRATLAGVYSATVLYWLNDRTPGSEATWAFLDRRIADVMKIEGLKARARRWQPLRPGTSPRR